MRSRTKKTRGDSLVHFSVHKKDRQAWGAPTLCGKRKVTASFDHTKVTCKKCMTHTNWSWRQYDAAHKNHLILCPNCDRGELIVTATTSNSYQLECSNCDHTELRYHQLIIDV